jgi:hypothetical protein
MNSSNPITIDDQVYDKLIVNLAVTTSYNTSGDRDMSIAMRVIPTRIDPIQGVQTADNSAYIVYRGRLAELQNESEQSCVLAMTQALQQFISIKGW